MECCLSLSRAMHQAENRYCHLNNYGLKWTTASHYLNSLCKYQQKFVRKYPISQGPGKEIDPKVLCHLQAVSIFASDKISQGGHFSVIVQAGARCLSEDYLWHWLQGGKALLPVRASKPYSESLWESKLCITVWSPFRPTEVVPKISSSGVVWKFVPY